MVKAVTIKLSQGQLRFFCGYFTGFIDSCPVKELVKDAKHNFIMCYKQLDNENKKLFREGIQEYFKDRKGAANMMIELIEEYKHSL